MIEQQIARCALLEHDRAVVKHTFAQQIKHGAHHMEHDDIVTGFDDRHMKLRIKIGLIRRIALGMGSFHFTKYRVDHFEVSVRGKLCGAFCG